ncbi:MAG: IS1634 family transposase [Nitrososphaerota archaeon]|nr:IS1634 family transposase [Nitrososphaerota archaeon]
MKASDVLSTSTKNIGAMALIKPVLDRAGIGETVDRYAPMERKGRGISNGEAVEVMVMNRLTSPTPLWRVEDWAREYALREVSGVSPGEVNDDRLARALDSISPAIEEIEAEVSLRMMKEYRIRPELVHLDFTSLYFEGAYDDSGFLKLGYSRDQKPDKKQVNIGIDVDASEGMPLFHTQHDGNAADPGMAVENLRKIRERLKPDRLIVVGDRSAIDGEIALMLGDYGLDFIGAMRMSQRIKELVASTPEGRFRPLDVKGVRGPKEGYSAAEAPIEFSHDGRKMEARGIVVLSGRKAELDRKRRDEGIRSIESRLDGVRAKLNGRKWMNPEFVRKKVESVLKEGKQKNYAHLVRAEVKGDYESLSLASSVDEEAVRREERLDGKYVLATTLRGWTAERVVEGYRSRYLVESRIRNMKSDMAVRPVFLHGDDRIRALVFVSVLALMVYTLMEIMARRKGIGSVRRNRSAPITANQLLLLFGRIGLVELRLKDRSRLRVVQDLNVLQTRVLKRLGLPMPETYVRVQSKPVA